MPTDSSGWTPYEPPVRPRRAVRRAVPVGQTIDPDLERLLLQEEYQNVVNEHQAQDVDEDDAYEDEEGSFEVYWDDSQDAEATDMSRTTLDEVREALRWPETTTLSRENPLWGTPTYFQQLQQNETIATREAAMPTQSQVADQIAINHYRPLSPNYLAQMDMAQTFFRQQSAGRYSDRTIMDIARSADEVRAAIELDESVGGDYYVPRPRYPLLHVAESTSHFDELTETKYGGVVGMLLMWENGKSILSVQRQYRRMGVARRLLRLASRESHEIHFWIHQNNTAAHQFLSSQGFVISGFNTSNAVRYSMSSAETHEDGVMT